MATDALATISIGGGTLLAAAMFAVLHLLRGSRPPPGAGDGLSDLEQPHVVRWQGQADGASRWLPWDLPVLWFLGVATVSVTVVLIRAIEQGDPVLAMAWVLVVPLVVTLLWLRYRLLVRRPDPVVVVHDRVIVGGPASDERQREIGVEPHHVLLRHRDGTATVAFAELTALGRINLRFHAAVPATRWLIRPLSPA